MFLLGSLYLAFVFYPAPEAAGVLVHYKTLAFIYIPALSVLGSTMFQMIRVYVKNRRVLAVVSSVHIVIFVVIGYVSLSNLYSLMGTLLFMGVGVVIGIFQYKILKKLKQVYHYETI